MVVKRAWYFNLEMNNYAVCNTADFTYFYLHVNRSFLTGNSEHNVECGCLLGHFGK